MLCRIFQKSGLGPPNGDRYAPFIEEEWEDDAALFVPGGEAEEDVANVSEGRAGGNDIEQVISLSCCIDQYMLTYTSVYMC